MAQNGSDDKERYARYLCSREWSELRERVRLRARGICERCHILPMDAVHHLTYARKYAERLEDLQAICNECHDWTHAKGGSNSRSTGRAIYLAGKISPDGWRSRIVTNLGEFQESNRFPKWSLDKDCISVVRDGIEYLFDYCGPYFDSGKHGENDCPHSHSSADGEHGSFDREMTFIRCEEAIARCDIFIAWIDSLDAFGTLVEIGMAHALGKEVVIAFDPNLHDAPQHLWFAGCCDESPTNHIDNPKTFVDVTLFWLIPFLKLRKPASGL